MKVKLVAFPTDKFPCFGFPVCMDNGKLYIPKYNDKDIVEDFEEIRIESLYTYDNTKDYEIVVGDDRTYTYFIEDGRYVLGLKENIFTYLTRVLDEIQDAPFSKLELAEFLNSDNRNIQEIQDECYRFLKEIDIEQAEQWAVENSYNASWEKSLSYRIMDKVRSVAKCKSPLPKLLDRKICTDENSENTKKYQLKK